MKKLFITLSTTALIFTMNLTVFAHPGRLDKNGGHNKTADGTYHYHIGDDRTIEYSTPQDSKTTVPASSTPPSTQGSSSSSTQKSSAASTQQTHPIRVIVNGKQLQFAQDPVIINNSVLVPIRYVAQELGCTVDWDAATRSVYINRSGVQLVKSSTAYDVAGVYIDNVAVEFTGQGAVNINGSVLIPVRVISEKLGQTVLWDSNTKTVSINSSIFESNEDTTSQTSGNSSALSTKPAAFYNEHPDVPDFKNILDIDTELIIEPSPESPAAYIYDSSNISNQHIEDYKKLLAENGFQYTQHISSEDMSFIEYEKSNVTVIIIQFPKGTDHGELDGVLDGNKPYLLIQIS